MKLFSGIFIGALLASGIYFFINKTNKEKEKLAFLASIDSSKVTAMNMNGQKSGDNKPEVKLIPAGTVTFLLAANNEIYYYKGIYSNVVEKTDYTELKKLIKKYKSEIKPDELMFVIKSQTGSSFKNAIAILDEMTINNVPPGHYMEEEITKAEIDGINIKKQTKNG